jgi:outer membrane protein W
MPNSFNPEHALMMKLLRAVVLYALCCGSAVLCAQTDTTQITLSPDTIDYYKNPLTPDFTISAADLDAELESQDVSGILQSSRDVFTAAAGFNWGAARFRVRGYDSNHTPVSINGILVNDMETGRATWSRWGGLNDVTRLMTVRTGLHPSSFNFAGIGGYAEIGVRATNFRAGTNVSYAAANRTYRHRIMATHSTGLMENNWAFTVSLSRRWADEGFVEGTYFDAAAYFIAAEKKLNKVHSFGLVGYGAPTVSGAAGLSVQEAYDLAGTNFYNPLWGFQNGEKRNARVRNTHQPMLMGTHYFTPNTDTKIQTSVFFSSGRSGVTGLNWYDARDPRPDFYRYLPSFYRPEDPNFAEATRAWQNDVNRRQINWDQLYFANSKNLFTIENADGRAGNTVTGNRSKYVLEEIRDDLTYYGGNTIITKRLSPNSKATGGAGVQMNRTDNFRVMHDLLGGDFWVDVDQFALRDFNNEDLAQNDLDRPNRVVRVGDRYGFDYTLSVRRYNAWGMYEYSTRKVELYAGADLSTTSFWRDSKMRNGRFPDDSFGQSSVQEFFNYGVKAGVEYKVTGRHFVTANFMHQTRPPAPRFSYLSPRTRHEVIPGLTSERIYSGDLNYVVRYPKFSARATVYYTEINDQVWARSFWHDELRTFVNYSMMGVDHLHMGTELGLRARIAQTWELTAAYAGGQYLWNSRPSAKITRDNAPEVLADNRTVYLKNYRIGGTPQTAGSLGLRYNATKFWFAGFNSNYFGNIYLDPNPDRRTQEALGNFVTSDPQWSALIDQTKLDDNFTVDVYFGKSWRIKRKYFVNLNVNVTNVLNNTDFAVGGFEQLRYDRTNIDRFPPRLSYLFGRTFFAMVSFRI